MKVFLSLAVILALVMMVYGNGTPCGNILLYLLYYLLFIAINLFELCKVVYFRFVIFLGDCGCCNSGNRFEPITEAEDSCQKYVQINMQTGERHEASCAGGLGWDISACTCNFYHNFRCCQKSNNFQSMVTFVSMFCKQSVCVSICLSVCLSVCLFDCVSQQDFVETFIQFIARMTVSINIYRNYINKTLNMYINSFLLINIKPLCRQFIKFWFFYYYIFKNKYAHTILDNQ